MTYVNAINAALTALNDNHIEVNPEVVDRLIALGNALTKRNSSKAGKPTKTQRENSVTKAQIANCLGANGPCKCGDIAAAVGISGQKCSALLTQMVAEGQVTKVTDKRVSIFRLAE